MAKSKLIAMLSALLSAVLLFVGIITAFANKTALAMTDSKVVNVGVLDDNGAINPVVLKELYSKLAGTTDATYDEVKTAAKTTADTSKSDATAHMYDGQTSALLRAKNSDKDIVLTFGGLQWTVVYLTTDRNDDVVVTLWLMNSNSLGSYNQSAWSAHKESNDTVYDSKVAYPQNRYSTSLIRSKGLNLGTMISYHKTDVTGALVAGAQDANHPLAPFTMTQEQLADTDKNSLMQYIDMPYLVQYQETESWITSRGQYDNTADPNKGNEAYGYPTKITTPTSWNNGAITKQGYSTYDTQSPSRANLDYNSYILNNYLVDNGQAASTSKKVTDGSNNKVAKSNMEASDLDGLYSEENGWKAAYEWDKDALDEVKTWTDAESWAFDTLWLPSLSETGWSGGSANIDTPKDSVWRPSANQRSNEDNYWLRSANKRNARGAYRLSATGAGNRTTTDVSSCVRPALHFNLTSAARAADGVEKPAKELRTKTAAYNGKEHSLYLNLGTPAGTANISLLVNVNEPLEKNADGEYVATEKAKLENGCLVATAAGEFKVTAKPANGFAWKPEEGADEDTPPDTEEIEFVLTITKGVYRIDSEYDDRNGVFSPSGEAQVIYKEHIDAWNGYELKVPTDAVITADDLENGATKSEFVITYTVVYRGTSNELPDRPEANAEWSTTPSFTSDAGDYRVFYKISDPAGNHVDTEILYFDVDVVKQVLYVTFKDSWDENYSAVTYGTAIKDEAELFQMLLDNIESVHDQNGDDATDQLTSDAFYFYLTTRRNTTGGHVEFREDLPVGTYYVRGYSLDDNVTVIRGDYANHPNVTSEPPVYRVVPKDITLNISDEGHVYGADPTLTALAFTNADEAGFIEGEDVTALGEIAFRIERSGSRFTLNKNLNAGEYDLTATDGVYGNYNVTFVKGVYTVEQAEPDVVVHYDPLTDVIYESAKEFPFGSGYYPGSSTLIAGDFTWDDVDYDDLHHGIYTYHWTFTPHDLVNYKVVKGETQITITEVLVQSISAEYRQGDVIIYTSDVLTAKEAIIRGSLTVIGHYNDGSIGELTDYTLSGNFNTAGTSTLTVTFEGKITTGGTRTCEFGVKVTPASLESISVAWINGLQDIQFWYHEILGNIDVLKEHFIVTGHGNDNSEFFINAYELSGDLVPGTVTITVSYLGKTDTIDVEISDIYADEKKEKEKEIDDWVQGKKDEIDDKVKKGELSPEEGDDLQKKVEEEGERMKDEVRRSTDPSTFEDVLDRANADFNQMVKDIKDARPREIGALFVVLAVVGATALGLGVAVLIVRKKKVL